MIVSGDQWPIFLYAGERYDEEDPWAGLFKSEVLLSVSTFYFFDICHMATNRCSLIYQAYKYVFTSPSSVDNHAKSTRSGNARIHGMTCVTRASIAYIATQVSSQHHVKHHVKYCNRCDLPSALPPSSQGRTLLRIPSVSTEVCWNISKIPTNTQKWRS